ncbi:MULTISPECIES: DEAD/DEAH box helicase [Sphingobium]|jgi:ATP-dependent RNA helicase RhlE|uniref:ATP-dependent RNA helicase RhlE n=1 Tax=Sphingobium fuliginis (strain ATCC 27551) TaxID=336203 RepID=A0A292ZEA6_SPHSA|nr:MULTISPECIES: DEAD/DEAH box helicase [Sphingobium]AJR25648.1 DEAD/DEAH box helicase [Sphingobium sp. YBL2]QOT72788.1 DEAD/DEAH box helicase [Sphingobium fuliginis]RYL98950.1 DEAD/DEAH box helicase [Sphingobium fuliginis]UXC92289.1 DEAD/DEAH box helicase [Sphingobium sp. RSMS]WDA37762.1 DEAD/DEAH box helicase [Sphingobium sp. YC-XJ3]
MQFTDLGLAEPILKALAAKKYASPTPIQAQAIPVLLKGKDLCGIAQTGTGKTAAFALPSLDHFARNPKPTPLQGCRMLVLSPTRELAAQIAQSFRDYGRFLKLSVEVVFGGVPINRQIRALGRGVDIVVATPGRLLDLIDQRAFTIKDTEIFVLDEADQMMDMGFIHPLKRIAKLLPKERQNLFFSATMPGEIEALASQFLHDPVKVSVAPQSTTAERVRQQATFVNQMEKQALLNLTIQKEDIDRALIFTRTKHGADRVVRFLEGAGIQAVAIHGNKSQAQRTTALQAFRHGHVKLLVATDIAARGIDVSGVSHVINFELPNVPEQYVHRIGRTARAGAEGVAISFVADDERPYLKAIERTTKVKLDVVPLPENFVEVVRNLPKAAPQRKGREQTPEQKTRRADGQRRYQDQQKQQRGNTERAHRPDGEAAKPAKKNFRRRRGGSNVGAHKGAVQKTGGR